MLPRIHHYYHRLLNCLSLHHLRGSPNLHRPIRVNLSHLHHLILYQCFLQLPNSPDLSSSPSHLRLFRCPPSLSIDFPQYHQWYHQCLLNLHQIFLYHLNCLVHPKLFHSYFRYCYSSCSQVHH